MGAISQNCVDGWHADGDAWARHSSVEITGGHDRKGRLQFNSLSAGQPISALSFKFYKESSGNGGVLRLYATSNANLLPSQYASAIYLGETAVFGSSVGWQTLTLTQAMMDVLYQFTGTWYLILSTSITVTMISYGTNAANLFGTFLDGTLYYSVGGVMKISNPYYSAGGVMKLGVQYYSVGGVMKMGIP